MRIAYITAGAADMYCGSCMRDNTLAAALIAKGHDCVLIPTYTPIRTDERDVSLSRVFFGGINLYLEQKSALFRHMPPFLDRLLSMPSLLRWVSRFAVKTDAAVLGELTVSMLNGLAGRQRREVLKLARWLERGPKPDVICLTNALLSGMVPELKRRLGVPVVCTLQGDDVFLEWLPERHKQRALQLVRKNCQEIDAFITTSKYYKQFMGDYLGIPMERTQVVYPGINLNGYESRKRAARNGSEFTIGYLARICPEKGLHVLVDAFSRLQQLPETPPCRLRVAGYLEARHRPYLGEQQQRAAAEGWADRFEYAGVVTLAEKIELLKGVDLFSVPTTYREPKGLYLLEAWASGVPVVQPDHGCFPELIEATGAGVLVPPGDSNALASNLRELLLDTARRTELGSNGAKAIRRDFHAERMAGDTLAVFQNLIGLR